MHKTHYIELMQTDRKFLLIETYSDKFYWDKCHLYEL